MFYPNALPPRHDLEAKRLNVVRKSRLLESPVNHQHVLEELVPSLMGRCPKLNPNQRPTMVREYGNIRRSVEPYAVDERRTLTIEIRPPSPVSIHDVSQRQRLFEPFKLTHALFYFSRHM